MDDQAVAPKAGPRRPIDAHTGRRTLIAGALSTLCAGRVMAGAPVMVRMRTALGPVTLALAADAAPLTVANFLAHVDRRLYDGASVYRVVKPAGDPNPVPIEVIQGGLSPRQSPLPPIAHETTRMSGLRHRDGTISMARGAPGTATSEVFICLGDNPALDFGGARNPDRQGFAAFGQVTEGMDVVRAVHAMTGAPGSGSGASSGQVLADPVAILDVRRMEATA